MPATITAASSAEVGSSSAGAAASAPAWRQLPFYDPSPVRDVADGAARSPTALRSANRIAALCVAPITPQLPPPDADDALGAVSGAAGAAAGQQELNDASHTRSTQAEPCVLLGDIDGSITVLHWRTYAPLAKWLAHPAGRVTHLAADQLGRVITLGEEEASRFPVLRAWDLRRLQGGAAWAPRLLSEVRVQHGSRPHPIAALAHTPSLSYLSLALADGSVLLLRSLDAALQSASQTTPVPLATPDSAPTPALALPKFKVIFQPSSGTAGSEPVTALGFAESAASTSQATKEAGAAAAAPSRRRARAPTTNAAPAAASTAATAPAATSVQLFIVTLARTLRYNVLGSGAGAPAAVVDDVGCALGCGAIVPGSLGSSTAQGALSGKMVVARDEAIYVVGSEGREVCLAYEGPKAAVHLSSTQLVIVSPPLPASAASASATVRNFVSSRDREQQQRGLASPLGVSPAGSGGALSARAGLNGAGARRGSAPTTDVAKVTVFDLDNKLVAYSGTFEGGVRLAWTGAQGEVCVLGDDGSLVRLEEKALRAKLDLLFRKNLFLLAVNVARSHAARSSASLSLASAMPGAADVDVAPASIDALLGDIFRKYGDHLYAKGDFEGAMAQFVKTIGVTQPSYVIRKFLDAQRINNLTTYLQELHARGMANSDHTTLLLNCYTKLKDVASLDRFIKRPPTLAAAAAHVDDDGPDAEEGASREELPFDLATAMRVCRQAGYYGHAAYLAKRYGEHDEYMRIQLEDARDFDDALAYLRSLPPHEAELHLQRYGKLLLAERPEATTDLLIELCSGAFHPKPSAVGTGVEAAQGKSVAAAYLSYLQVGSYGKVGATAAVPAQTSTSTPTMQPTTSERTSMAVEPYSLDGEAATAQAAQQQGQVYATPSPRLFFAHFIRHPLHFVRFLETVALARWGQSVDMEAHAPSHEPLSASTVLAPLATPAPAEGSEEQAKLALRQLGMEPGDDAYEDDERADQRAIWNTLLELYLASSRESRADVALPQAASGLDGAQRAARRERALHLLEQHEALPYDITQALVLCSLEAFTEGLVLLYERLGMYEDVLRFWMDASEENAARGDAEADAAHSSRVMAALWRYGPVCPHLYPMVLRYLVSTEAILARHQDDVAKVLRHIEEHDLMGPLEVVQALGRSGVATVGMVREHLTRAVLQEREEIEADRRLIDSYRHETAKKTAEVAELTDADAPRVFQLTRCTACAGQLDLPSVHFMCKHSYHQRCLGENEAECPNCARAHGVIREIRRGNEALGDRHELFMQEVQEAEDGFDTVAAMFSKGLLSGRLAAAATDVAAV